MKSSNFLIYVESFGFLEKNSSEDSPLFVSTMASAKHFKKKEAEALARKMCEDFTLVYVVKWVSSTYSSDNAEKVFELYG